MRASHRAQPIHFIQATTTSQALHTGYEMASVKIRSTRRLRSWLVEQVSSGKYPGLVWDNPEKTMFRIPWKHAGKQDFRSEEDAAIFKAWAEFKGKLSEKGQSDPASWKTRLRCALNKSPEFSEVTERSQLDISEPYKVYRLVPLDEQGLAEVKKEDGDKAVRRNKKRRRSEAEGNEEIQPKVIKDEVASVQQITMEVETSTGKEATLHKREAAEATLILKSNSKNNEIQLNFLIENVPPSGDGKASHSFNITVYYIGQEVLRREVLGSDVRIAYIPLSPSPPTSNGSSFPRISLPPPPTDAGCSESLAIISKLLPYMEKGVVLTSNGMGIYAKRFCQGRVFWRGPHCGAGPHKMERATEPTMLFNKEIFRQELEEFQNGGDPPQSEIMLCFGEELFDGDNLVDKHIIIKISLPWAKKLIEEVQSFRESLAILQSLANESPSGEVTLNLVELPHQPVKAL
ncbi:interferon regulatory factor 9 isoform X1 [Electrophorus electricus]|nr:interferon regulatory factor 9 isoform X1 [Electrophorus electricus]